MDSREAVTDLHAPSGPISGDLETRKRNTYGVCGIKRRKDLKKRPPRLPKRSRSLPNRQKKHDFWTTIYVFRQKLIKIKGFRSSSCLKQIPRKKLC